MRNQEVWASLLKYSQFKMSFIVAFSQSRFYGVIGTGKTNDSITFGNFLLQLWDSFKDVEYFDEDRWILVIDNASIHKTEYIQKNCGTQKDTDNYHYPVWAIAQSSRKADPFNKSKMTAHSNKKLMSLALVKSIVNEVAKLNLQKMVEVSYREEWDKWFIKSFLLKIWFYSYIFCSSAYLLAMTFVFLC